MSEKIKEHMQEVGKQVLFKKIDITAFEIGGVILDIPDNLKVYIDKDNSRKSSLNVFNKFGKIKPKLVTIYHFL